jgi:hypothetical protein
MAETIGDRAASTFPAMTGGAGRQLVAWGTKAWAAEQAAADIWVACKVPAGATVIGGYLVCTDMDTDGSETIDFDVGYAANGDVVADPDAFGNFGPTPGDVSVHLPVAGVFLPFAGALASGGPITLNRDTNIILTFTDDAATFTAGRTTLVVNYVCA